MFERERERVLADSELNRIFAGSTELERVPAESTADVRLAVLFAGGCALAAFVDAVDPRGLGQEAATVFLLATSAFAIGRSIVNRLRGSWVRFQQELAALMAGSTCVLGALQGVDAIQVALTWWGVLALAGTGIVRLALRSR